MRVISGTFGGRRLESPADMSVRPTTDRVKEALFSAIQFEIEGKSVIDVFSGSGQLGLEALSRGAKSAVFLDKSSESLALTKRNAERCGVGGLFVKCDSEEYLKNCKNKFGLAFLDPPYNSGILGSVLPVLSKKMEDGGIIAAESAVQEQLPERLENGFVISKQKKYGKIKLSFYRQEEDK